MDERHVVLITGASAGIGAALAREFGRRGADLALLARRRDRLKTIASGLARTGRRALALACDVTRPEEVAAAVHEAVAALGRLDIAVANAGFGVTGRVERLTPDDFRRQFETNVFGVLHTVYATLPALAETRGRLALLGSVSGHVSAPGAAPYSMSKFAIRALADALREELRPRGVSVTLISPGFVESDIRRVDRHGVFHPETPDHMPRWLLMPADVAARKIATAIARRRSEAVITGHGKVLVFLARHAPRALRALLRGLTPRARRERE